jgi:hypothetical protein
MLRPEDIRQIAKFITDDPDVFVEEELTSQARKDLSPKSFVFPPTKEDPNGHYPIHDESHKNNAKSRVAQLSGQSSWMKKRGLSVAEVKRRVYAAVGKPEDD